MMKIESKEKLAKLLATEDLDVQHQQVETAYFDVKSRTLILPTWKDMPNHLYDLLVGHEVGHALFTPTSQDRLTKAYKKTSKACINILEDVRIEKLVKTRYPGLRKQFFSGYQHLIEKDFFGLSKRPISGMNILDKINLFFKIPNAVNIEFNDIEQSFIDKIEVAKSFKDVEVIAEEIYSYAKEEQEKEEQAGDDENSKPQFSDEKMEGDFEESDETESGERESESESEEEDGDVDIDETEKAEGEGEETPIDEDQDAFDRYMDDDSSKLEPVDSIPEPEGNEDSKDAVRSTTYEHFQERLDGLVDKTVENFYLTIPDKANLKDAVVDYKVVHKNIDDFYGDKEKNPKQWDCWDNEKFNALKKAVYDRGRATLNKFKKDSIKTVNHIAMEFERKKAADVYKKVMVTKTGVLDTNKLFSAKYNDDVFKKSVRMPEGKNHGLVMIIDWSGSMSDNIFGCIKQVIELSFFCKKVNIPFEVYSFSEDDPSNQNADGSYKNNPISFHYKHNDLVVDPRVRLRNYLSSRMNAKDYNNGLLNMSILANRFQQNMQYPSYDRFHYFPCPKEDELRCTPLCGAIMLSEHVIRKFRKDNNLQCVHATFLTDGEASGSVYKYDITKNTEASRMASRGEMYKDNVNYYIKDTKTKKNHLIMKGGFFGRGGSLTPALLDIVKERLGINIVGFFILKSFNNSQLWRYVPKQKHVTYAAGQEFFKKWVTKAKKDGWFLKTECGYDEYYVIRGTDLKKDFDADLNVKPEMTAHRMAQNFMKKNNAFKTNRIILSRFIDLITDNTTV